jgi:selenocysteine lyase/cysteine desulfurase
MNKKNLDAEFPLDPELSHLNHAGVGPWPRSTQETICAFAQENMLHGSTNYRQWEQTENHLRELAASLLNAPTPNSIALLKNTSEALSTIAYGIDWQPGDEIVIPSGEFPSNRIVWESLIEAYDVTVKIVAQDKTTSSLEDALIAACTDRTRLISVSSVSYATGYRMDLNRLGNHCQAHNILFCIDAIQSLGAIPFDVQACHADFVAADGHKWMLAPEGVALFYINPEKIKSLQLRQFGWHMVKHLGEFDRHEWTGASTARRFECGSPNNMGIHALKQSLELLLEHGIDHIYQAISEKCHTIEKSLEQLGFEIISEQRPEYRSGIITFQHPDIDSESLYHYLMKRKVLCAYRGGGVRFSPHFYTPPSSIENALEWVRTFITQEAQGNSS